MLTKKQKLGILAVAVILLGGLAFASFSYSNDLQGKVRNIFRGSRNTGTEQINQTRNNYDVRQGRNRDDGPPEPPPPVSNLEGPPEPPPPDISNLEGPPEPPPPDISNLGGVEDIPPPEVSNKGFDWIE